MLPDESCLAKDEHGCDMILIRKEHLEDFPLLIDWLRERGYGRDAGVLKLRLHSDDRQDVQCVKLLTTLMAEKFKEKAYDERRKRCIFTYMPDVQLALKAALKDDIYQYVRAESSAQERKEFVQKTTSVATYVGASQNCCSQCLSAEGLIGIRKHFFQVLRLSAPYLDTIIEKAEEWKSVKDGADTSFNVLPQQVSKIIYGAGIQLNPDKHIPICDGFSISELGTISDLLDEKYDGIAYPYIYSGSKHSLFPWHVEDGGLYSINYVFAGAPKIWFAIPAAYFGLVDRITDGFRIERGHAGCRAVLADHKVLVADPDYFKAHYGVPYTTLVQEPGDFIITLPFALHSGFNAGNNLAIAANFADKNWIELGLYAPVCTCSETQVHLGLTNILKAHRPDLLETYLSGSALVFPPTHPREVRWPASYSAAAKKTDHCSSFNIKHHMNATSNRSNSTDPTKKGTVQTLKARTVYCPKCNASFKENKILRLKQHIQTKHSEEEEHLIRVVDTKYEPWKPKSDAGFFCTICGCFRRGSITHIKEHHQQKHPHLKFQPARKK